MKREEVKMANVPFTGTVEVDDSEGVSTISLDGETGQVSIGGGGKGNVIISERGIGGPGPGPPAPQGRPGTLTVNNNLGTPMVQITGGGVTLYEPVNHASAINLTSRDANARA